ncbi:MULTISPECIES: hypothetical protein [unclassified Streptomyces]|uniref:hypothetical protein n=1 Tax=unclassified Streptomyces TaxID=2593676 RepID=UPI0038011F62
MSVPAVRKDRTAGSGRPAESRRDAGRLDGWTAGRLDGWTAGRLDGWTVRTASVSGAFATAACGGY